MKIEGLPSKLNFSKRLLLSAAALVAVAAPIVWGQTTPTQNPAQPPPTKATPLPSFEVASVKLNHSGERTGFLIQKGGILANDNIKLVIEIAYGVKKDQVLGGPGWINSEVYDIDAKFEESLAQEFQKIPKTERNDRVSLMLQSFLADRFKLRVHRETKELPIYVLVIAKNGPKLHEATSDETYSNGMKMPNGDPMGAGIAIMERGYLTSQGVTMAQAAGGLSLEMDRPVVDKTGLTGTYDFTLKWTPDEKGGPMAGAPANNSPNAMPLDTSGPSLFTAIQEQLGLKLMPQKGPVEVLVIDHIERPSEN